jgi:DNA polymerase-1
MEVNGHPILFDPAEIMEVMSREDVIGYDSETTGISPWRSNIALMQFYGRNSGVVGLCRVVDGHIPDPIPSLFGLGKTLVVHNGVSFDIPFLSTHHVDFRGTRWFDTLVGETVVVGSNRRNVSVSLRNTAKRRLGKTISKDQQKSSWASPVLTPAQIEYAAKDVIDLPDLMQSHIERAEQTGQTTALNMEMDLVPIFAQMTINGIPLNPAVARRYASEQEELAEEKRKLILDALGNINLNSPIQIKKALAKVGIVVPSTRVEVLEDLIRDGIDNYEMLEYIVDYRHAIKRVSMFSDEWIAEHITNGIVHPKWWQCGTDTGRTSCTEPNIMQIPKDGRWIFGNKAGYLMVACDYSQIELRVVAHIARDENLKRALRGTDIHKFNASQSLGIPEDQVTPSQRIAAKGISFLLVFGGGWKTLYSYARRNGSDITPKDAMRMYDGFFENYPGIGNLIDKARMMARSSQPVVTIRLPNGLRRNLVGTTKKSTTIVNTAVQGTAAVGFKYGLLEMDKAGLTKYLSAVVHDEAVSCVPEAEAVDYGRTMQECMVRGMERVVPNIKVGEPAIGAEWKK